MGMREIPTDEKLREYTGKFGPFDVLSVRTFLEFLSSAKNTTMMLERHFDNYKISEGKFTLLMILYQNKDVGRELNHADLADRAGVTRGTITGLIDGLEKASLVKRNAYPQDRRKITVTLTDQGIAFLEDILPGYYSTIGTIMKTLSKQEIQSFSKVLEKIADKVTLLLEKRI